MKNASTLWHVPIVMILLGIVLAIIGTTPQPAMPDDSEAAHFSAERAMDHVRIIAARPHPTGSVANAEVRSYLVEQLERLGAKVTLPQGTVPDSALDRYGRWSGTRPDALTLTNVIGVIPGRDRDAEAILLMAHHDTVYGSPGAPDDTSGIAAILESVRVIVEQGVAKRDIIILLTDGEELGLLGATQFVETNSMADRVGAVVNLEARGGGGRTTLFQTSRLNGQAVEMYADSVGRPGGSSLATHIYEILPNDTDLTPLLARDYTAYNLSFIGRPGQYHSPKATPDALDQSALQDMGDQTLDLTMALANAEALPGRAENRTFFDVFGLFLISYGTVAGWIVLTITAILHFVCLRTNNVGAWKGSLAASALVILGGGVLLYGFNMLSGAGAGPAIYYDRLAALPKLEVQALLICAAMLIASAPLWAGRRGSIIGVMAAIGLQIVAPTTAFIVVWPLLLSGIAGFATARSNGVLAKIVAVLCGAIAIGFLLQFGHQFMQGVGASLPMVTALLAALSLPTLRAVIPRANFRKTAWIGAILLVAALAMALWVKFDPVADSVPLYQSMKG